MSDNEQPRSRFQVTSVVVGVDETRGKTQVRWKVWHKGSPVADVVVPRMKGESLAEVDVTPVTEAIAKHYSVGVDAVVYETGPKQSPHRLLPTKAIVWVPRTCEHLLADAACDLRTCEGTPGMDTPLESGKVYLDTDTVTDTGGITEAREVIGRVERDTGATVVAGFVGETWWPERRERKVCGYGFVADGTPVRVLTFESRENRAMPPHTFTVVWAGHIGGEMLLRERYARQGAVVTAITEHLDRLADERTMAAHDGGWVWLKHPPLGWQVLTEEHGLVTISEASTNDGFTLRVTDADGVFRFVDRPGAKRWFCAPAEAVAEGHLCDDECDVPDHPHDGQVYVLPQPPGAKGPALAEQVRAAIAGARWSFGSGRIGKHKFTGPMMHPALPDRRLEPYEWRALADQVRALGGGAWMRDVKAFACESHDVGTPWRAATLSTRERVAAWLAGTGTADTSTDTQPDAGDASEAGVTHVEAGGTVVAVTARVDISADTSAVGQADTDADMVFDDVADWASVPGVLDA